MMADVFADVVDGFGHRLGIAGLAPGPGGVVDLRIERLGRLQLEALGDDLLVTLIRPWPPRAKNAARTALSLCHWRENHAWDIHVGAMGSEDLALTARLPLGEADVPTLERLLPYLANLLNQIEQAG
jgi:type III secretion system chaperone SycN